MPTMETQFEWRGLTLDIEFEFTSGEAPSPRTMSNPMGADDGSGPEIENIEVRVGDEDFDTSNIIYWEDFSHHFEYCDGKYYWRTPSGASEVMPHTASKLKHGTFKKKRAIFKRKDGNIEKVGEEFYYPVYQRKDLDNEIMEHCLEAAAEYEE